VDFYCISHHPDAHFHCHCPSPYHPRRPHQPGRGAEEGVKLRRPFVQSPEIQVIENGGFRDF
jgi:hypothetical protein